MPGLSGIGAACQLREHHPTRTVAVLEAREASGGTWDLFNYPGIRSDSDMFTFGFSWRPWPGDRALADGASILDYLRTVAERVRRRRADPLPPPRHPGELGLAPPRAGRSRSTATASRRR